MKPAILMKYKFIHNQSPVVFSQGKPVKMALTCFFCTFYILFIFKPFGISELTLGWRLSIALIYSIIPTFLYLLIYVLIIKNLLHKRSIKLTYLQEFGIYVSAFFITGIIDSYVLLLITRIFEVTHFFPPNFFFKSIYYSSIIGISIYLVAKFNDLLVHYRDLSSNNSKILKDDTFTFISSSKNSTIIKLKADSILFFQSNRNYVSVFYIDENLKEREHRVRKTLKELNEYINKNEISFYRCHRCFIVNLNYLEFINGNLRSGTLVLKKKYIIPISRSKFANLKEIVKK